MSQEIVFTSARHGLRTGSTGFCTVRSTRGMPGNLAQLLERLTGYSHVFDAYGDQANLNPVNFAHYIARLGDQKLHILARVSNAPLDHTNRSNKLAHLLAVDSSQLETSLSEGPAAESLQVRWVRDWSSDREPSMLPDEEQIILPMIDQPGPGLCNVWKEATGDAGWAAELAASADGGSTPVQVILPRDAGNREPTWALQLVHEALSLIPPAQRWDVSYSTFFAANLPVSVTCHWQFVLDGTDLAKRARLDQRARKIDIPVIAAEKRSAPVNSLTKFTAIAARPWNTTQVDSSIARRQPQKRVHRSHPEAAADAGLGYEEDPDVGLPIRSAVKTPRPGIVKGFSEGRSRQSRGPLLLRPASLMLCVAMAVVIVFLVQQGLRQEESSAMQDIVKSSNARTKSQNEKNQEKQQREQELQKENMEEQRRKEADDEKQRLLVMSEKSHEKDTAPVSKPHAELIPPPEETPRVPGLPPLQDVRDKKNRLELKVPRSGLNSGPEGPIRLAKIYVTSLANFDLKRIIGGQSVLKPGLDFSLEPRDQKNDLIREWEVIRKSMSGVGLGGSPDVVGRFLLDEHSVLSFRWDKKNEGFEIVNCLLEMEASESGTKPELEKCRLREVSRVKPFRFDLGKAEWLELLVSRKELANYERLELHCDFVNLPGQVTKTGRAVLNVSESVKYHIHGATSGKYPPKAEIKVELLESEQDVRIAIGLTLLELPDHSRSNGQAELKLMPYTPKLMGKMNDDIKTAVAEIKNVREALKKARVQWEKTMAETPQHRNLKGELDEDFKKKLDEHTATVERLHDRVKAGSAEILELNSLEADLSTMLEAIAKNGQLQFSLRLMIPDAGDGGLELVSTEEAQR